MLAASHTHFAPALQEADCLALPDGNAPDPRFVEDFHTKVRRMLWSRPRSL